MSEFTYCIDKIINRIPTSPVQMRARLQVSLPYVLPPLSVSSRPASPIGFRSEGPPMAEGSAPLWTSEELSDRRMFFAQHPTTTADLIDAM